MKLVGFPELLAEFTYSRKDVPYTWGENDCVTFTADAVMAITGIDPIPELRGLWSNAEQAATTLEAQGGLIAAVDARFPRIESVFAQRGDICLVRDANNLLSLAVCVGGGFCAAPGVEEMLLVSMGAVLMAWTV